MMMAPFLETGEMRMLRMLRRSMMTGRRRSMMTGAWSLRGNRHTAKLKREIEVLVGIED